MKGQFLDTFKVFLHSRPSIDARLESRFSFMNHSPTKVSGVRLGLSFRRKLRVGIGYSWLDTDVSEKKLITDASGNSRFTDDHFKFGYLCFYADFVFHKTKRWQLSVPIQVGTGAYWTQYSDGIKITRWCGLGLDVCARLALRNTNFVGDKLNSFVLAPKLLIWFDQIFYEVFPKTKITQKYGPAYW